MPDDLKAVISTTGRSPKAHASCYTRLLGIRWAVENVANLDQLPAAGATLVIVDPKHAGDTGRSCRVRVLV